MDFRELDLLLAESRDALASDESGADALSSALVSLLRRVRDNGEDSCFLIPCPTSGPTSTHFKFWAINFDYVLGQEEACYSFISIYVCARMRVKRVKLCAER